MIGNAFLESAQVILRPVEPSDAPLIAACNNDPQVRVSFFTHTPISVERQREEIANYYRPGADYIPFVICPRDTGDAIGVTAFHRVDRVNRVAVYSIIICDPAGRGKGYAGIVTRMMLQYAFDVLGLHRVQLQTWEKNARALKTYEKCGFRHEGVLRELMHHDGEYFDFAIMGILEEEWRELKKGAAE